MYNKEFIIVKDRHPRFSEVLNDCCVSLCVPANQNESLASILVKLCSKITALESRVTEMETTIEDLEARIEELEA